jgi:hypothetical protein
VIRSDHVMTALDHSRKRAAPPNPSRIRGDVCGSKWRPENDHFAQITSPDPARQPRKFLESPIKLEKQKDAENHDVGFAGSGGKVL